MVVVVGGGSREAALFEVVVVDELALTTPQHLRKEQHVM
jgi:hypothetical protein